MNKKDLALFKKAAKFTGPEIDFINRQTEILLTDEHRPIVYIALCSSLVGCLVRDSEFKLAPGTITDLILKGVEI